jgi:hypothetical protein
MAMPDSELLDPKPSVTHRAVAVLRRHQGRADHLSDKTVARLIRQAATDAGLDAASPVIRCAAACSPSAARIARRWPT